MHKILSLFILSCFLFFSCSDKKAKAKVDSGLMGETYVTQFGNVSMTLWKDLKRNGNDISLNGGENLKDDVRGISFSSDEFRINDLNYYKENVVNIGGKDDAQFILNLAVHLKRTDMYSNQVSIEDVVKGEYGHDLRTIQIRGKESYYDDNLCFLYATLQNGSKVALFQFVCHEKDMPFYYPELLKSLSSIQL